MAAIDRKLITVVDGPTVNGRQLHTATTGIIYSVSLANGMIVTSPETFERATAHQKAELTEKK